MTKTPARSQKILIKLLSFCPALGILFLIFGFSAQDGESSGSLSFRISLFLVELFSPVLPASSLRTTAYERAELIHLFVRKAAHMTEYFLLALSLQLPLAACPAKQIHWKKRIGIGFVFTVLFAALDEFHQRFVPGRSGNLTDVCIDSVGALLASGILAVFFMFSKRKNKT